MAMKTSRSCSSRGWGLGALSPECSCAPRAVRLEWKRRDRSPKPRRASSAAAGPRGSRQGIGTGAPGELGPRVPASPGRQAGRSGARAQVRAGGHPGLARVAGTRRGATRAALHLLRSRSPTPAPPRPAPPPPQPGPVGGAGGRGPEVAGTEAQRRNIPAWPQRPQTAQTQAPLQPPHRSLSTFARVSCVRSPSPLNRSSRSSSSSLALGWSCPVYSPGHSVQFTAQAIGPGGPESCTRSQQLRHRSRGSLLSGPHLAHGRPPAPCHLAVTAATAVAQPRQRTDRGPSPAHLHLVLQKSLTSPSLPRSSLAPAPIL